MTESIRVAVQGALGRMGREVIDTLVKEPDMLPVGAADANAQTDSIALLGGSGRIPLSTSLEDVIADADVVVDFTNGAGAAAAIETAIPNGKHLVIGSTGIPDSAVERAEKLASDNGVGVFIAPNFTIGVAVMIHLVEQAARFFDYADLIETHHEAKIDAPSGTALAIAEAAAQAKAEAFKAPAAETELVAGTRGGQHRGVVIHSARMPGRVAHHEMVFGHVGQTLTIRHDSVNRESFMPGVMLAVREIQNRPGLTIGLGKLLGL